MLVWKPYDYGVVCSLKGRKLFEGDFGFIFSTSIRVFIFGVILHAMLRV